MKRLFGIALAAGINLAAIAAASASPLSANVGRFDVPSAVEQVQYGGYCYRLRRDCESGQGSCRRYYRECGDRDRGDRDRGDRGDFRSGPPAWSCGDWRRECARLYGSQTNRWYQCMGQPGAVNACTR